MQHQSFSVNLLKIFLVIFVVACGADSKKGSNDNHQEPELPLKPISAGVFSGGANSGKIPENTSLGTTIRKAAFGKAFALLRSDGSIFSFGEPASGGSGELEGKNFIKVVGSNHAFAALKQDGSIYAWGDPAYGGTNPNPLETGFVDIISNRYGFAALKDDGSIHSWWGNINMGGAPAGMVNAPTNDGFIMITSGSNSFAAIDEEDSIHIWGNVTDVIVDTPEEGIFTMISGGAYVYSALNNAGEVSLWGGAYGFTLNPPTDSFVDIYFGAAVLYAENKYSAANSVVGIKNDRSLVAWGQTTASMAKTIATSVASIAMTSSAYAALSDEGELTVWGASSNGGSFTPTPMPPANTVFTKVVGNGSMNGGAFAALTTDGKIVAWGDTAYGGTNAPSAPGSVFVDIGANEKAFTAIKDDGTLVTWGDPTFAGNEFSE